MKIWGEEDFKVESVSHESFSGFRTTKRYPQNLDYYYSQEHGKRRSIPNFGAEEYQCYGTCLCRTRRAIIGATKASRVIGYLLTTVSVVIAYKKAKEFFRNECKNRLLEECEVSSITSEVDSCEINSEHEESSLPRIENENEFEEDNRVYWCKGNCLLNQKLTHINSKQMAEDFECNRLKLSGEVSVTIPSNLNPNTIARESFAKNYLKEFCKKKSRKKIIYEYINKEGVLRHNSYRFINFCVSKSWNYYKSNPTVRCFQTSPKPLNNNGMKYWEFKDD